MLAHIFSDLGQRVKKTYIGCALKSPFLEAWKPGIPGRRLVGKMKRVSEAEATSQKGKSLSGPGLRHGPGQGCLALGRAEFIGVGRP